MKSRTIIIFNKSDVSQLLVLLLATFVGPSKCISDHHCSITF